MKEVSFLGWLLEQFEQIDPTIQPMPQEPIQPGDEVVGVIENLHTKKLLIVAEKLRRMKENLSEDYSKEPFEDVVAHNEGREDADLLVHDSSKCKTCSLWQELQHLQDQTNTTYLLFWTSVRHELEDEMGGKLRKFDGITLRENWTIVLFKKEKNEVDKMIEFIEEALRKNIF